MIKPPKVDRQREHQANERTFLAWLRTSIALIGFGLAIARFALFLQQVQLTLAQPAPQHHLIFNSENLGISLIGVGILAIGLAAWRYNQVFWQIERGDYKPNRSAVWIMTLVVMGFGILSIPLLLWRNPPPPVPQNPRNLSRL
jgi:putative membrane protein